MDARDAEIIRLRKEVDRLNAELKDIKRDLLVPSVEVPIGLHLTAKQERIMALLIKGQVVTMQAVRRVLADAKSPEDMHESNLSVSMFHLRNKLKPRGIVIETRRGVGYCLTPDSREIIRKMQCGTPT